MEEHSVGLDLLIFRAGGNRFGLDAAQIREILRLSEWQLHRGNIAGMHHAFREEVEISVVEMAAVIGMAEPMPLEDAKLVLSRSAGPGVGFVIGEPEEMARIEAEDIELLPTLIRPMVKGRGMWGIVDRKEGAVILIDLVEAAVGIAVCNRADPKQGDVRMEP